MFILFIKIFFEKFKTIQLRNAVLIAIKPKNPPTPKGIEGIFLIVNRSRGVQFLVFSRSIQFLVFRFNPKPKTQNPTTINRHPSPIS